MDPYSIFVNDLPRHLTYGEIKGAFWPYQTTPALKILKKENYIIVTFEKEDTVQHILQDKDCIKLKGQHVTIKQATKQFIPKYVHLPPSFFLPP